MNRTAKTLLVAALVGVVGMAFRVSWNALRDVARSIGADTTAATLYPFVVDGLMALALVATLVLTDDARKFALRVLAGYTIASLVLNYVHGLVPALHSKSVDWSRLADWDPANWALVLLATSLPVGSIYFGSDLVAKVLHHRPDDHDAVPYGERAGHPAQHPHTRDAVEFDRSHTPAPAVPVLSVLEDQPQLTARVDGERADGSHTPHAVPAQSPSTDEEEARQAAYEEAELERMRQDARRTYGESVQATRPLSARALGEAYGMSESWGRKQILAARDDADRPHLTAVPAGTG
ncbi:DUF2637 domain-containing protein [Streptomyces sp. APSN-46.1]|uniref:DUF2637 domain-containing protein n=1 Tax=Streptomyces sp. APSN-46.1 TaxID=2929049 RepID=UPI001FB32C61|nr:DUF2637 domain-containing protein [Streptomyces sp. APSN-46.1]MCJ1678311.1 DUF2637 domain-containing protein [Streptomyces sp. APSN-46.1]